MGTGLKRKVGVEDGELNWCPNFGPGKLGTPCIATMGIICSKLLCIHTDMSIVDN